MADKRAIFEQALNRGISYNWDQRWEEAVVEFQKAAAAVPDDPGPYDGMGTAFKELDQLQKALENYKLAARYSRGNLLYLRNVADMQERLEQHADAGKTYMAIGELELSRNNLNNAEENWNRAVALDPDLLRAHQRLASVFQRKKNIRGAIREYLAIARILQKLGNDDKALRACEMGLKLDPRNKDVLTAIEYIRQGQPLYEGEFASGATGGLGTGPLLGDDLGAPSGETAVPVQQAKQLALEQLAEKLFSDANAQTSALISKALDFQTRGLTNEAINTYEEAIAAGESGPAAYFNLGLLYQDKMRFEDAITAFDRSKEDRRFRLASHFELGESFRARGRLDRAIEHFITVLKIVDLGTVQHDQADRLIELYENLAASLATQGEREQATNFANALVEFLSHKGWEDKVKEARGRLNTISNAGMMILGDVLTSGTEQVLESLYLCQEYARRGMYNTAIEETFRAIQLAPDYLPAHVQLAEVLALQGRREVAAAKFKMIANTFRSRDDMSGAIAAYEEVLNLQPLELAVRTRLIDMLKQHGQIDRALEHYMSMGDGYYQLAKADQAREVYQEALKLSPRGSSEKEWKAKLLRAIGDIDMQRLDWRRALASYKELRQIDADEERTAITLVDLYFKVGQPNNGVRELDQYLKQLVQKGRGAKVMGILEDMVQRRPHDANLVNRLCRIYIQRGQVKKAITHLETLGEAQLEAGESAAAIRTIEAIIRLKPPNAASYQKLLDNLKQEQ